MSSVAEKYSNISVDLSKAPLLAERVEVPDSVVVFVAPDCFTDQLALPK